MGAKNRQFIFTCNNYTDLDQVKVQSIDCRYMIYGREVAPTTGTPHLQGFVSFNNARSFNAIRHLFPNGTWLQVARGSVDQNIKYTSKDENVFEKGNRPLSKTAQSQSQRDRYDRARQLAKVGDFDAIDSDIYIRHRSSLHAIARDAYVCPPDKTDVTGIWIFGQSGVGKSHLARDRFPNAYMKNPTTKWWDGYYKQENVIIDDFDKRCLGR
jgi:hypothetical protein